MPLRREREIVLLQILYLFVIPVILLYFDVVPTSLRALMLLGICAILFGIVRHEKWKSETIGIHSPNHRWYVPYIIFTITGILMLLYVAHELGYVPASHWWDNPRFVLLFIPISILQEFAFRGFLVPSLKTIKMSRTMIVVVTTFLFMLIHIIYPPLQVALPVSFIGGLAFALMYEKYPNLFLASLAHAALNFVAVLYGFFVIK